MSAGTIPNWAEFSKQVEQLLRSDVVATIEKGQWRLMVSMMNEWYLKFFTNRALRKSSASISNLIRNACPGGGDCPRNDLGRCVRQWKSKKEGRVLSLTYLLTSGANFPPRLLISWMMFDGR